jgi:hypothetical protein
MIGTRTTALILAMSLLSAAPSVAVKVFADDTIIQASNQEIEPSNSAQINQPGDGVGVFGVPPGVVALGSVPAVFPTLASAIPSS